MLNPTLPGCAERVTTLRMASDRCGDIVRSMDTLFETTITGVDRDHALARFSDPVTSHQADAALRKREGPANTVKKGTHRHLALQCFACGPRTADQVQSMVGIDGIWKRVSDLKNMGFIAPTGHTRRSRSGREQEVLEITQAGREALNGL